MATGGQDVPRGRGSSEFVDDTILEAFVPAASQVNVQELLEAWDGEVLEDKNTIVPFIEQRQFLLLDEEVPVHIVLRTKLIEEDLLEAYLKRLAISLEARAYGALHTRPDSSHAKAEKQSTTANELLYTGTIDPDDEPIICATEVQHEGQDESTQYAYIFWKLIVPIPRPKSKISKLSIYFTPSASLRPPQASKRKSLGEDDDYLPPLQPQPANLLAPFADDPGLHGVKPKLLVSSLYRTSSSSQAQLLQQSLRSGSRRLFRAAPAFIWRLRFITAPAPADHGATIAALDLEITPFAASPLRMVSVALELALGKVEDLTPILPKTSRPGDQFTLLYKLWPAKGEALAALGGNPPTLKIEARGEVLVNDVCLPQIHFSYSTPVDLPSPSRPTSRAGAGSITSPKKPTPAKPVGPDSLLPTAELPNTTPALETQIGHGSDLPNGLVLSITGPPGITVEEPFNWDLFVVNHSERVQRIAVVAIPKRRPWTRLSQHSSTAAKTNSKSTETTKLDIAPAVLPDIQIYEQAKASTQDPTGLICLSPDLRIGPLPPRSCFATKIKFVALLPGVQNLEALRIVDLTSQTQDAVDVRWLPDIIVQKKEGGVTCDDSSG